jgi:hypothetical protein
MLGILIAVTSNDNEIYQQERPDKQYHGGGDCIVARLKALSLRSGSRACLKLRTILMIVRIDNVNLVERTHQIPFASKSLLPPHQTVRLVAT